MKKHEIDLNKAKEFLNKFPGILECKSHGYCGLVARFIQYPNFGIIKSSNDEKSLLVAPKIQWNEHYVGWLNSEDKNKDKLVVYRNGIGILHSWTDYDKVYDNAEFESRVNVLVKEYKNILQNLKIKDIEKDFKE